MTLPNRKGWMTGQLASLPACPPFPSFTDFEAKALAAIADLFGPEASQFRQQLENSQVVDRINTVHGFYTRVRVDRRVCLPLQIQRKGGHFDVGGLPHGVGIVLWGEEGYLETIEGYTYDDDGLEGWDLRELTLLRTAQLG